MKQYLAPLPVWWCRPRDLPRITSRAFAILCSIMFCNIFSHEYYRVFIKYCVFSLNFVIFLNIASSAAALLFYLPGGCTHTDTEGKQGKARVRNILKSSEKTQYLMNTLYK